MFTSFKILKISRSNTSNWVIVNVHYHISKINHLSAAHFHFLLDFWSLFGFK